MSKMGGNEKLLNDMEGIKKALYLDNKVGRRSLMSGATNRSMSVGKTHQKSKNKDDSTGKESKKSIWSWKGLKSLAVRNKKFNCCFSVQVHSIEGLPTLLDELCLVVHWKRRDGELTTRPVVVSQGIAVFEEQLTHTCSISATKNGPNQSAKYEAKHFLLYASIYATPDLDLGKHRIDLTRLLPLALDELEENSSGKWTTSFRLSGKAKGATMNVSFEYHMVGKTFTVFPSNTTLLEVNLRRNTESVAKLLGQCEQSDELSTRIRRSGSLPALSSASQHSAENIKDLHEVLPVPSSELSVSVNVMYQKLEEEKVESSVDCKPHIGVCCDEIKTLKPDLALLSESDKGNIENEGDLSEVSIRELGVEVAAEVWEGKEEDTTKTDVPSEENAETDCCLGMSHEEEPQLALLSKEVETESKNLSVSACNLETEESAKESIMKELESALKRVSDLANEGLDSQEDENEVINHEGGLHIKGNFGELRKGKSRSLDYDAESVASDFLDMLATEQSQFSPSFESEPDSPRERLLRQFERDTLAGGGSLLIFDMDIDHQEFACDAPTQSDRRSIYKDFDYSCNVDSYVETPKIEIESTSNKTGASMLEDLETEALMHEWGLNERAFQFSPPKSSRGFGSPIDIPLEDPCQLPPLGEGLGPFVKTKNGGFLRSMNPSLFKNAKSGGSLIMQVSSLVVVPAEMGSGIMDILQHLASIGIEKLSIQANKLMPLEDITGQTMQHLRWETAPSFDGTVRQDLLQHEFEFGQNMAGIQCNKGKWYRPKSSKLELSSARLEKDSKYVSLEDLAPLAMDKIEALSIEGLRIQSGMSDEDTPSNVRPQSIGEFSAIEGKRVNFGGAVGLEGTGGLQLLNVKDNGGGDVDGLMGLSLTLEEWMRLDAGEIDEISEQTSKLLAAHHGTCIDLFRGRSKRCGKGKNCGLLGNSFTVALMVQLRDPLRNYEPVGTPMLALIQVQRVFVTPKSKIYSTVSQGRKSNEDDDDEPKPPKKEAGGVEVNEDNIREDEEIPRYKITEVHVAGLKTEKGKKKLWGSSSQQQSGSRWLLANGMGKRNKHPLMKSKSGNKSSIAAASQETTTTVQPGETLWSISSRVHGTGAKWEELAALNPHIRNPNVIFPNEKIRLR